MTNQWILTQVDYDDNDNRQDTTLATCDSRSAMIDAILVAHKVSFKCIVTEWNNEEGDGEIVEQANADEWLQVELKECAPMPETKSVAQKHTVKRIAIGNGEYLAQQYEYRGFEVYKKDTYSWGVKFQRGYFKTRAEAVAWIDQQLAKKETA